MAAARAARSSPPPLTPAAAAAQKQAQQQLIRLGVLAAILAVFLVPLIPSPIAGVDWRTFAWAQVAPTLLAPFPDPAIGMPLPPAPMLTWLYRALVVAGVYLIGGMALHLRGLYVQRKRPLTQPRTYLRVRTPLEVKLKPTDGLALVRTLHGVVPPAGALGNGAPLVLRWTGQPEKPITQGVSLLGGETLVTSVQKTLEGLGSGTQTDGREDPLLKACEAGRVLCWADVRLATADDLPIAVATGTETPLVDALLPALSPQKGVFAGDVQIILRPVGDRAWRIPVLARLEAAKGDAGTSERKALEQKAAGPAYDVCMRVLAVAASPEAGVAMVQTLGAALASSAQAVGLTQQRLVAGAVQCLPAVIEPPTTARGRTRAVAFALAGVLALVGTFALWRFGWTHGAPQLWALPVLLGSATVAAG